MNTFQDKVVLITGGSSGIGMYVAFLFAEEGARVVITYKENKQGAQEVMEHIINSGGSCQVLQADLTQENDAKRIIELTVAQFGRIDILVNNVGRYIGGDEWDGDSDIWIQSLLQNVVSVMRVSKYALEVFQKQRSGIMVNVASKHGVSGHADALSYGAAKAGVINITQSYATLLSQFGGRANVISPTAINTGYWLTAPKEELEERLAKSPLLDPKGVAAKIVFLASDEAKNMNGQNFIIE